MRLPLMILALLALAACETVQGVGRDVQTGGEIVEDAADEVQDELPRQ